MTRTLITEETAQELITAINDLKTSMALSNQTMLGVVTLQTEHERILRGSGSEIGLVATVDKHSQAITGAQWIAGVLSVPALGAVGWSLITMLSEYIARK